MKSWAITDKGIVRSQNQDTFYVYCDDDKPFAVLIVCDGMGGAKSGNVASDLACRIFKEEIKKSIRPDISIEEAGFDIKSALNVANKAVFELSNAEEECRGMGTTAVAAAVLNDKVVFANVGDSRAYRISGTDIKQVTRDHSLVEDMILRGDITREESKNHPNKNLITRAIGTMPDVKCDIFYSDIYDGDYILLCTDGLSNIISDEEILGQVRESESVEEGCERLVRLALQNGAPDNVTVVLLER